MLKTRSNIRWKITMTGCCSIPPREAPAIPLWINGRPVLTMPMAFHEIRESASQRLIRRVPMVDVDLAASALTVGQQSAPISEEGVPAFLSELEIALVELTEHFSGLSAVETHAHLDAGKADVANAIDYIRGLAAESPASSAQAHTVALAFAGAGMPVTAALKLVLPVVIHGGAVTLVPHTGAPSCALAMAELCSQCGLPDGLFNVVYVDDAVAQQLLIDHHPSLLRLFGPSAWAQRWQAVALGHDVPCERVLA